MTVYHPERTFAIPRNQVIEHPSKCLTMTSPRSIKNQMHISCLTLALNKNKQAYNENSKP